MIKLTKLIEKLPINHKFIVILVFSSVTSLILAVLVLLPVEISEFKDSIRAEIYASAQIVGDRSNAALLFNDHRLALQNLAFLKTRPEIKVACLYDANANVVLQLKKPSYQDKNCPPITQTTPRSFLSKNLEISQVIEIEKGYCWHRYNLCRFERWVLE